MVNPWKGFQGTESPLLLYEKSLLWTAQPAY